MWWWHGFGCDFQLVIESMLMIISDVVFVQVLLIMIFNSTIDMFWMWCSSSLLIWLGWWHSMRFWYNVCYHVWMIFDVILIWFSTTWLIWFWMWFAWSLLMWFRPEFQCCVFDCVFFRSFLTRFPIMIVDHVWYDVGCDFHASCWFDFDYAVH